MKNRSPIMPIALVTLASGGVLGSFAQTVHKNRPAHSLENYLTQNKVITHNQDRKALWSALWKVWPKTFESSQVDLAVNNGAHITLYAENQSATAICFYRDSKIYTFDVHAGQISPVVMAKVLPPINSITFEDSTGAAGPGFLIWSNGQIEASIGSSRE